MIIDLALVMPVYNEEACIGEVVRSWYEMLDGLNINFQMIILNDGSTDASEEVLAPFGINEMIDIINKENSGHGPTILVGYKKAVERAEWVFQCDSDNEMSEKYFYSLWKRREAYDALFGVRQDRKQKIGRKIITSCAKITTRFCFGGCISDINTPYRLVRSKFLKQIVEQIPENVFAPNVIIAGALTKMDLHIYERSIPHEGRKTGKVSITNWKLWKSAVRAFWQTLSCRPAVKIGNQTEARTDVVRSNIE